MSSIGSFLVLGFVLALWIAAALWSRGARLGPDRHEDGLLGRPSRHGD